MRRLAFSLALGAAACGQTVDTPTTETQPAAPQPASVQTSGEPCRELANSTDDAGMETLGVVSGYTISATRGALACSEPALGRVDCAMTGPGEAHALGQERLGFALDAGQTATFIVGPDGARCFLNESGG